MIPVKAATIVSETSIGFPFGLIKSFSPVTRAAAAVAKSLGTNWVPSASVWTEKGRAVGAIELKTCINCFSNLSPNISDSL